MIRDFDAEDPRVVYQGHNTKSGGACGQEICMYYSSIAPSESSKQANTRVSGGLIEFARSEASQIPKGSRAQFLRVFSIVICPLPTRQMPGWQVKLSLSSSLARVQQH
jgi:hypothetical protein